MNKKGGGACGAPSEGMLNGGTDATAGREKEGVSIQSCPQSAMMTLALGLPLWLPYDSKVSISSIPSTTFPNTTCFPLSLPGHTSGSAANTGHTNDTTVGSVAPPLLHYKCLLMTSATRTDGRLKNVVRFFRVSLHEGSYHSVLTVQMKNWEPLVFGPALAMDRIPGPVCFKMKFSSSNLLP